MSNDDLFRIPCACATLRRATRVVTQVYEQAFRTLGLTAPQFTVIAVLHGFGELNQGRIAELLAADSTTLTRVIRLMRNRGWVEATPGSDRRERYLKLTPEGEKLYQEAKPLWLGVQDRIRDAVGFTEWEQMLTTVDRLASGAQAVGSKPA